MSTPAARTPHRLSPVVLAAAVTAALALTSCSGPDENARSSAGSSSHASPAAQGVIDLKSAKAAVDAYEKTNIKANAKQDAALLATVEDGMAYVQDRAHYEQWKTWSAADRKQYASPFRYTHRTYLIPKSGTGASSWFAMTATTSDPSHQRGLFVFDKRDGRYKLVAAVWASYKLPIPDVAVDGHGLATAVDPAARVGALTPDAVGAAVTDLDVSGGKREGSRLTSTPASKQAVKEYTDRNSGEDGTWRTANFFSIKVAHPQVYALRTTDGGALVLAPHAFKIEFLHKRFMHGGTIVPGKQEAIYNSAHRPVVTDDYQGQALVALPLTGKARLITRDVQMVDSR
ncbi:hypothetical protein [Streptomyces sp. NPDC093223]|uniref:hypothetical protein n=1 Tax=Streptomyces sp. NPDC093223 TaxID=3366033 RepID=UPI0038030026